MLKSFKHCKLYLLMFVELVANAMNRVVPKHVELWVRPPLKMLEGCLRTAVQFTKVDGQTVTEAVRVILHGVYAQCAIGKNNRLADGYKLVALPALPVNTEFFDDVVLSDITRTYRRIIASFQKQGYYWVPSKFSLSKVNYLLFAHKTSALGSKISDLTLEQKAAFYANGVAIAQYGFQPYDRMRPGVQVRTFEESNIVVKAIDFVKHMRECVKSEPSLKTMWNEIKHKSKTVPFGDGQLYISPSSTLWTLAPIQLNNQPRYRIETLKVIGVAKGNPFIFLKGVIVRLSWQEWREKCRAAGVEDTFDGILVNQHSVKNKIKLPIERDSIFNIGYHADSRQFSGRSQIFGSQAFLRSNNLTNPNAYWEAVEGQISEFERVTKAGDVKAFLRLVTGDPKVFDGSPYYRGMLGRALVGLPLPLLNSMNADGNMTETIKNMVIRRVPRPKIARSFRVHPACKDHVFSHGKSMRLGINQVGLTPAEAKKLKATIGDTVVIIRSPKSAGYPAIVLKVISVSERCFSINPILYTLWNQGDFDGDSIAVYANDGIVKSELKMVDILKVLFEGVDEGFNYRLRQATILSWRNTSARSALNKVKRDGLWGSVIGPVLQCILSKAGTGAYDNVASKALYGGLSLHHQRTCWDKITQLCISNMKHVGDPIPSPYEMTIRLNEAGIALGVLDDIHCLLSANRVRFEEATAHTDRDGIPDRRTSDDRSRRIVQSYINMEPGKLLVAEQKYTRAFQKNARAVLNGWFAALDSTSKTAISQIIQLNGDRPAYRRVNGKGGRVYDLVAFIGIFNDVLNNPNGRSTNDRFAAMSDVIADIADGNAQVTSNCWRAIFNVALFENFKGWLLTRPFDPATEVEVCRLIREIADAALHSIHVDPSTRIETNASEEEVIAEVNMLGENEE